jgi:hypothetical protein
MAITTVAGAVAGARPPMRLSKLTGSTTGAAGNWVSPWYAAGDPVTAVAGSAGMAGEALTTVTGSLRFQNPASGNSYLLNSSNLAWVTDTAQSVLLCDRLWQQSGIVVTDTAAQTINSVAWPARDMNASTNGAGVWIALEVSSTTGAGAAVPVIEYTNSAGGGTKTGTCLRYTASAAAGRLCFFDLAAGDVGVRSVQSITLGTSLTSGVVHLVALRPIAMLPATNKSQAKAAYIDAFGAGFARLYDNSVLMAVIVANQSNTFPMAGQVTVTQG